MPLCQRRVPDAEAELRLLTEPGIAELGEPSPAELRARPSASTKLLCLKGARAQQQAAWRSFAELQLNNAEHFGPREHRGGSSCSPG